MSDDTRTFNHIKAGDKVTRMLAGIVPMELKVVHVDDRYIYAGAPWEEGTPPEDYAGWKFDKTYGYEVDEGIGWGVPGPDGAITPTGSFLVLPAKREE
jgi:hypothetical protein